MKRQKALIVTTVFVAVFGLFMLFKPSSAQLLFDGVEVAENSTLTYYLKVTYDGVDKYGVVSSHDVMAKVNSGIIMVEDKIPQGLTFLEFVTSSDGSIGAVKKNDPNVLCLGKVIDDGVVNDYSYHGLHYDPETRKVSFQVENLQAGCELTVGIKTRTPFLNDPNTPYTTDRKDFYNFAQTQEEDKTENSDTVHVFMGNESATLYDVTYTLQNAPEGVVAPEVESYTANNEVSVAMEPAVEGYTFSGWSSPDVVVEDGKFIMPNTNVSFIGSFIPKTKYHVRYQVQGDIPTDYVLPTEKEYYNGQYVDIDSLKEGDIIGAYRFKGWENHQVDITDSNKFLMPEEDVTFIGEFEELSYEVSYQFYDTVLPPNADQLLPVTKKYHAGEMVSVEEKPSVSGYEFLGWYQEDEFVMPEEDIVIYGEWKELLGNFTPEITKEIVHGKSYYQPGDIIEYQITVTNPEDFEIQSVMIKETGGSYFVPGDGYDISSDSYAIISSIPAHSSVVLNSRYLVKTEDENEIITESQLTGAVAENYYELSDGSYSSMKKSSLKAALTLCNTIQAIDSHEKIQFSITSSSLNTDILLGHDECKTLYVIPGEYKVKEVLPQEYEILSITGDVAADDETVNALEGKKYEVHYINQFKKKGFFHSFGRVINEIN